MWGKLWQTLDTMIAGHAEVRDLGERYIPGLFEWRISGLGRTPHTGIYGYAKGCSCGEPGMPGYWGMAKDHDSNGYQNHGCGECRAIEIGMCVRAMVWMDAGDTSKERENTILGMSDNMFVM